MPVVAVDINNTEPFIPAGHQPERQFQRLSGVLTFAVDPSHTANAAIADLGLVPVDAAGRVVFESDFSLICATAGPATDHCLPAGRVLVDVVNRGRTTWTRFDEGSDGLLFGPSAVAAAATPWAVLELGWQHDVYRGAPGANGVGRLLGLTTPLLATPHGDSGGQPEGRLVSGLVSVQIRPNARCQTWPLASRQHRPHPADVTSPATLYVKESEDSPPTALPRMAWQFARQPHRSGAMGHLFFTGSATVPSPEHLYLESPGFLPGKVYELVYTAVAAPLNGAGLLVVRDAAAWLKQPGALSRVVTATLDCLLPL